MASKLFQKTAELSADAKLSRQIGPAGVVALKGTGISSTTTLRASSFFSNNWSKLKSGLKSIPMYFQKPYSMGKLILYALIFLGLVVFSIYFYNKVVYNKNIFIKEPFENPLAQEKAYALGNAVKLTSINVNEDDNKLMNIQPVTFKQTAYLGLQTFDSNLGILEQLRLGSRFFFLQIDYIEKDLGKEFDKPFEPQLVMRNNAGRMISQNGASLKKVALSLQKYFNNNNIPSYDSPIVLFLHFVRLPYSITDTENYKKYFNSVYKALSILDSIIVKGYSKVSKESDLFSKKFSEFNKQIIIGTNIDTSVMNGKIDLDKYIHFRYYQNDADAVDITDSQTKDSTAFIYSANYLLSIKDTEKFIKQHKDKFVIVKPKNEQILKKEQIDRLLNKYNVNIVLHDYFSDTPENSTSILELYNKSSYKLKSIF